MNDAAGFSSWTIDIRRAASPYETGHDIELVLHAGFNAARVYVRQNGARRNPCLTAGNTCEFEGAAPWPTSNRTPRLLASKSRSEGALSQSSMGLGHKACL